MVRLKEEKRFVCRKRNIFQFLHGAIKRDGFKIFPMNLSNFNSYMVRLKAHGTWILSN